MNFGQQLLQRYLSSMGHQDLNGVGTDSGPFYTQPGLASIGGSTQIGRNQFGGTLGIANGQPFGSANINHRIIGKFGPQGK